MLGSHEVLPSYPLIARDVMLHTGLANPVAAPTARHGQACRVWAEIRHSRVGRDVTAPLTFSRG